MTENDYIAEYVKEQHPSILGADYTLWRLRKMIINFGDALAKTIRTLPKEDLKRMMEEAEDGDSGEDEDRADNSGL